MLYTHIQCKTAIHKLRESGKPYHHDLNIYRGCEHQCQYCFAIYSQKYMNESNYFNQIYIKDNIAEVLDKELSKTSKREVINIGGVCDSYQPIEQETKLMRKVLKVMIKYNNPIIISTKSNLILRDLDLIKILSKTTAVNIAATITCENKTIQSIIEPNTSSSIERFKMLDIIKKETNAIVGVHLMPIIPHLSDTKENLEWIYKCASQISADYVLPGTLYLRGETRNVFMTMVKNNFPHLCNDFYKRYSKQFDKLAYKKQLYAMINELKKKYNINHNYMKPLNDRLKETKITQLTLF